MHGELRFSERIGARPIKEILQVNGMDTDLRNCLWNNIIEDILPLYQTYSASPIEKSPRAIFLLCIWKKFFKRPIDSIPTYRDSFGSDNVYADKALFELRQWFFQAVWYDVYDFIDFLVSENALFTKTFNITLSREKSGYRFVNGLLSKITSIEEVKEIEEAIEGSEKWSSINTHLRTALGFISDRKNPDYRNSIKESISAVEALCIILTGDPKTTLGKALSVLERKHALHSALKEAFRALYGYTSDTAGIRHSLLENDSPVNFEEAKFMLVSCSAFINYLIARVAE